MQGKLRHIILQTWGLRLERDPAWIKLP